jgi:hypothetical protein
VPTAAKVRSTEGITKREYSREGRFMADPQTPAQAPADLLAWLTAAQRQGTRSGASAGLVRVQNLLGGQQGIVNLFTRIQYESERGGRPS